MTKDKEDIKQKIEEIERQMGLTGFWDDKASAQTKVRELIEFKNQLKGFGKYNKGNAVITILSGAGGDDAEDFTRMLFEMYSKFIKNKGWEAYILHEHKTEHGGYRNISFEVKGNSAYGTLKNESGVHRLVRISPFSPKKLRHTSFSMVEVIPKFERGEQKDIKIPEKDIRVEFMRAGGPGGQNVNKRETAVRVVHVPTNISVHVSTERSQERNRETAIDLLRAKLYKKLKEAKKEEREQFGGDKTIEIEWGNQIRSYVLHPYKLVKDHRTGVEVSDVDSVLEDGNIEEFVEAEKNL